MANSTVTLDTDTPSSGGMPRTSIIPGSIVEANLMSETSNASDCFIQQQFSAKLQAFMIGYVSSIYSYYSVYK
jgi:hypothetical protein